VCGWGCARHQNRTFEEKRKLIVTAEEQRAVTQRKILEAKQEEEAIKLRLEMNMSLEALKFRYAGGRPTST
jgi:hypothetical protein